MTGRPTGHFGYLAFNNGGKDRFHHHHHYHHHHQRGQVISRRQRHGGHDVTPAASTGPLEQSIPRPITSFHDNIIQALAALMGNYGNLIAIISIICEFGSRN